MTTFYSGLIQTGKCPAANPSLFTGARHTHQKNWLKKFTGLGYCRRVKGLRVNLLAGFVLCGLLCLNLGVFVFSFGPGVAGTMAAPLPLDGDDTNDASDVDAATAPSACREEAAWQRFPAPAGLPVSRLLFPSLPPVHSLPDWRFIERAAASPRAPACCR